MLTIRRFRWLSFKARTWRRLASVLELLWILPFAVLAAKKACNEFDIANAYGTRLQAQEKADLEAERIRRDQALLGLAREKRRHAAALIQHAEALEKEVALSTELHALRKADDASAA